MPQKYEREIEEILAKLDDAPRAGGRPVLVPLPPHPENPRPPPRRMPTLRLGPALNPSTLMVATVALAVLGYPLQWVYPMASTATGLLATACLLLALGMSIARWGGGSRPERTWRGRPVDDRPGFGASLERRWRRWRAHRRFRDPRWN